MNKPAPPVAPDVPLGDMDLEKVSKHKNFAGTVTRGDHVFVILKKRLSDDEELHMRDLARGKRD